MAFENLWKNEIANSPPLSLALLILLPAPGHYHILSKMCR